MFGNSQGPGSEETPLFHCGEDWNVFGAVFYSSVAERKNALKGPIPVFPPHWIEPHFTEGTNIAISQGAILLESVFSPRIRCDHDHRPLQAAGRDFIGGNKEELRWHLFVDQLWIASPGTVRDIPQRRLF